LPSQPDVKFAGIVAPYIWTPVETAAGKRPLTVLVVQLYYVKLKLSSSFENKRFFARMCLYLLALVNSWGTPKNYKTTQNYGSSLYTSFFITHLRSLPIYLKINYIGK